MRLRTIACALAIAMLLVLSVGSAAATTSTTRLQKLAQEQTNLLLKFYEGQNVRRRSAERARFRRNRRRVPASRVELRPRRSNAHLQDKRSIGLRRPRRVRDH